MSNCPSCGVSLSGDSSFCPQCGAELEPMTAAPPPPPPGGAARPIGGTSRQDMGPVTFGAPDVGHEVWGDDEPVPDTGTVTGLAIFCILCCCMPGGVAGLMLANQAKTAVATGDLATARAKLQQAYYVLGTSIALGLIFGVLYLFVSVAAEM